MHELPITENILEIAVRHGQQAGAVRITELHLVIGQLSSIVDDSIQFYWDIVSRGTICEGAILQFERISAQFLCLDCGNTYGYEHQLSACPACDSVRVKVIAGEEFQLKSIEIDTEKETQS
jgi:hydrogenase nickel incorporation protein HypA/HybF